MVKLIRTLWEVKVIRFGVVGFFNFLIDFTLLNIFVAVFHLPVIAANTLSVTLAITSSYFLNHHIVFRHPDSPTLKNYGKFFIITGISAIGIQDLIIEVIAPHIVSVDPSATVTILGHTISAQTLELNIAKLVAVIVGMVWNFLLYRFVVFRQPGQQPEDELLSV